MLNLFHACKVIHNTYVWMNITCVFHFQSMAQGRANQRVQRIVENETNLKPLIPINAHTLYRKSKWRTNQYFFLHNFAYIFIDFHFFSSIISVGRALNVHESNQDGINLQFPRMKEIDGQALSTLVSNVWKELLRPS